MASLLKKVQTLISANLHAMVDSALKANSLAVFDQYVREVEDNLENLEDAVATVGGELKTLRRKKSDLEQRSAELDRNIDIFLREGKEDLALAAQSKLNSIDRLLQNYDEMLERQETEFQNLKDARLKLEAKLTTVKQEREELQALLDLARSKEITAKAIKSLDDLMGAGDEDVARVAEGIRARLDKASARSEMLSTSLEAQMDQVLERSTLEAQLAERKARLGLD
ncbi:MAG: PspA/IM30 family protein [Anaerolineae bacterium]|jgi:phage shock protein A|nr:PspA/IM30 family protein [Anaerolineae bacterium]